MLLVTVCMVSGLVFQQRIANVDVLRILEQTAVNV